jgi:hypothetical protein
MVLDDTTLLVISGIIVVVCGGSFILNTSVNRNDGPGRAWSLAFIAGILATIAYAVYGLDDSAWWTLIAGNGSLALGIGSMWSGTRLLVRTVISSDPSLPRHPRRLSTWSS